MKFNLISLLSNAAISSSALFIPMLAQDGLGASDAQIGVIVAVYGLMTFISFYLFGRASDVYNWEFFIHLGVGVSAITFFLQVLTDPSFIFPFLANPWLLAVARGLAGFSIGIFPAALTAYVYESNRPLGSFSSFGALGWSVGTFVAGVVALYWGVFVWSSVCLFLAFLISLMVPNISRSRLNIPLFPWKLMKKNWHAYIPFFMRHLGANCIWTIYPLYIQSLGANKFWVAVIYTVNTASQFIFMQFVDRFEGKVLLNAGLVFSFITFLMYPLAQHFYQLIPMQVLLACSWSCLYVGLLLYLMEYNIEKATCTGILGSVMSLATVFGALLGGSISQFFGFRATMYTAVAFTVVGFGFFKIGLRKPQSSSR